MKFDFFSNILFIIDLLYVFFYEYLKYLCIGNYTSFIQTLSYKLSCKNILYIKLFQAFALNNTLIDESINNEIIKYTDCAPYVFDDIDTDLISNIVKKYDLIYTHSYPINSGMISLVYKLTMRSTGKEVILKIKRKNIDEKLEDAIERIQFLVSMLSYFPKFNTLDIPLLFNKNILLLKEQLNFEKEVNNTREMNEACKNLSYVKIPTIFEEVTKEYPNAILMEYIEGKHISDVDKSDYEIYAKLVLKYGFVNMFFHGMNHGDLHSGNILFIKNKSVEGVINKDIDEYQIGVIDFGIVLRFDKLIRDTLIMICSELFTKSSRELSIDIFNALLEPRGILDTIPKEHMENLILITEEIISNIIKKSKETNQLMIYEFINNLNNYLNSNNLNKYGLKINDNFIKMQMGITMAHGISLSLCKDNYMKVANVVLNDLFHTDLFLE